MKKYTCTFYTGTESTETKPCMAYLFPKSGGKTIKYMHEQLIEIDSRCFIMIKSYSRHLVAQFHTFKPLISLIDYLSDSYK